MANTLSITWQDVGGKKVVTSYTVDASYAIGSAAMIALINALRAASQATIVGFSLAVEGDLTTLTNGAASAADTYDTVDDQAILQFNVTASGNKKRCTIPAPLATIFDQTGAYQQQNVDLADSLVAAIVTAGVTTQVLVSDEDSAVTLQKGWRKGQRHT